MRMRAELNTVFAAELDAAGTEREHLVRALLAATSWPVWSVLRYDLGLDLPASTRVMTVERAAPCCDPPVPKPQRGCDGSTATAQT